MRPPTTTRTRPTTRMSSPEPTPQPRGVFKISDSLADEQLALAASRYSAAATLADLQQEYFLFTPGLLYEYVPLGGREPHIDYEAEFGSLEICGLQLEPPLFDGFPTTVWNHLLWAIPRGHETNYISWLGSLVLGERATGRSWRLRNRTITAIDVLALSKRATLPEQLPTVALMAWCLEASTGTYWLSDARCPPAGLCLPRVCYTPQAYAAAGAFAQEMFNPQGTNPDPYQAADAAEAQQLGLTTEELIERELAERVRQARLKEEPDERGEAQED